MKDVVTYVGINAHKKDLFVAMASGQPAAPVGWTVDNQPHALTRLVRELERDAPAFHALTSAHTLQIPRHAPPRHTSAQWSRRADAH
jgi:hypothetical protein